MRNQPPILKPIPRRPHEASQASDHSTPGLDVDAEVLGEGSRSKSILNLTTSTLFGIYSRTALDPTSPTPETSTPWGTGAQTPIQHHTPDKLDAWERPQVLAQQARPQKFRDFFMPLILRTVLLFGFGVVYGVVLTHLHDEESVAPVSFTGNLNRNSWPYLVLWGSAGVGLGTLLPYIDLVWDDMIGSTKKPLPTKRRRRSMSAQLATRSSGESDEDDHKTAFRLGTEWGSAIRGIGAFLGTSFALRKLPWQSTFQATLTIFLVDPVIWYIVDRSSSGLLISTIFGIVGTGILLGINPALLPPPTPQPQYVSLGGGPTSLDDLFAGDQISVWIWIASVLFCSSVCFGNIGRRLALPTVGQLQV